MPSKTPAKAAKRPKPKGKAKVVAKPAKRGPADIVKAEPALFDPLTPGEIADALRTLTEDRRVAPMAKVGRYRVITSEPLVVKPPHLLAGHRLARVVAYDYAADRAVDACIDLDAGVVVHLGVDKSQPMLSQSEEALAISVAMIDERVRSKLQLGDAPQSTLHYWGRTSNDLSYARRSAAVVFGRDNGHASIVAVVDLLDQTVTQVVAAELW
ncbi:MAG TPA: hypothetical protein VGG28_32350 [Kofleriaceae bacterium]|jgi:hypothetical protein